ncbi:MAG TPA: tetratricopeptide repeat protein [Candidatus Limnocylindrales bacterium]|nr:tetratricopeptide repeat protein [Candidatus Limnocylindrales bacterium]
MGESADAVPPRLPERFLPIAMAVFVVSLTVRLVHLFQIRRAPFFALLMGDAQSYHTWAQQIAAGDWVGTDVFYQAPLYPYLLGLVYTLLGEGPLTVRLFQAAIGSLACVLLAYAAWRLFSKPAGLAAGLMLAVYAPAIFFDGLIQKSVLDGFLLCLTLALLTRLLTQPSRPVSWLWVGAAVGCLTLSRENALVLAAAMLVWLFRKPPLVSKERLVPAAWLLAGLAIVLLPVAIRNRVVGGEFQLTTSQFGPNFYIGNNESSSGVYQPLRFGHGDPRYERQDATELAQQATGRTLSGGEVSEYWTRRALDYIRTQPGDWLQLTGRKIMLVWNAAEVADTEDELTYADWSIVLRVAGWVFHFGVLAPLALLGLWATWPRRGELWLLYLLPAAYAVTLVAFAVMARYRYPLVPFLILFAAAGVTTARRLLLATRPQLASGVVAIVAVAVFCNWRVYSMADMRSITDANVGTELQAQGRLDEAIALYRAALLRDPNDALTYNNLGTALAAKGQLDEAIVHYRRALALAPKDADGHYNLANALMAQGKLADAADQFQEALRIEPGLVEAHLNLGNALSELGRSDEAAGHYRQAIAMRPDMVEAVNNLGLVLSDRGQLDEAIAQFRRALAIDPDFADAHSNLGSALAQTGANAEALTHLQRAVALLPRSADAHNELGVVLAQQNRLDEAIGEFRQAIGLEPGLVAAHGNLGMALQLQGKLDEAIQQYQEATRLAPDNQEMQRRLQAARPAR